MFLSREMRKYQERLLRFVTSLVDVRFLEMTFWLAARPPTGFSRDFPST